MKITLLLLFTLLIFACKNKLTTNNTLLEKYVSQYKTNRYKNVDSFLILTKLIDSTLEFTEDKNLKAFNNFVKGIYFNATSNFQLSLKYLNEAENEFTNIHNLDSLKATITLLKGDVYLNIGNYAEAINNVLNAKNLFEKNNLIEGTNNCNITLARVYQSKGEILKAKEILKTQINTGDINSNLKALHTLANIYGEEGLIDSALLIDNNVLSKHSDLEFSNIISPFYNNKALCLSEKKQFDSAIYYFKKSYYIDSSSDNKKNMAANDEDLGSLYLQENNFEIARVYFEKALNTSKKLGRKNSIYSSYNNLYKLYKQKQDFKQSLLFNDSAKKIKNEIDNVALNARIEELNLIYETSKKEQKIQEQKLTIVKKNSLIIFSIAILLIASLLGFTYHRRQKLKQELLLQKEIFTQQEEKTKAIFNAEELERQRISRDLHDNMGAYTSALIANIQQLKIKNIDPLITSKMENNATYILSSLRETIWVLNNKEILLSEFSDDFKNYCFKVLKNFEQINFEANEDINNNIKLNAHTAIHLKKIMQEIVQNIIKHSNATKIEYEISNSTFLKIKIMDNGNGFDASNQKNGFGIENMKFRANEINMNLTIDSKENVGTSISINKN